MNREDYEKFITDIKSKLDETNQALISEELLGLMSTYNNSLEDNKKLFDDNQKLKNENEELLKVNGRLFQKIGFEDEKPKVIPAIENEESKPCLEEVINEKGDFI